MQFQNPFPTETVETIQQTQSIAFALRFILLQVGSLKCDDWECMFQHCWFGCIFVFTGIHQAQSPKTPPDAPHHPQASVAETFLSAGLHSNMGSQEATWDQLIRDDWTPQVSVNVACELPTEINKPKAWTSWIIPTKESPRNFVAVFCCYPCQVSFGSLINHVNHVFISCEIELRNPTKTGDLQRAP